MDFLRTHVYVGLSEIQCIWQVHSFFLKIQCRTVSFIFKIFKTPLKKQLWSQRQKLQKIWLVKLSKSSLKVLFDVTITFLSFGKLHRGHTAFVLGRRSKRAKAHLVVKISFSRLLASAQVWLLLRQYAEVWRRTCAPSLAPTIINQWTILASPTVKSPSETYSWPFLQPTFLYLTGKKMPQNTSKMDKLIWKVLLYPTRLKFTFA